jgi:hypothetical protein
MNELIVPLIVGSAARWLVYTFLLWVMIKIQKIQYSGLGLLASSAAAVLTSRIPVVGSYASYAVLLLCLWKTTRANLAPDLLFTVAIAGALMFCVDLWALGLVMGKLGFDQERTLLAEAAEPAPVEAESVETGAQAAPPQTPTGMKEERETPVPPEPVVQRMKVHPLGIVVKGIAYSPTHSLAMLQADKRIFTVCPGEGFVFSARHERMEVRCRAITRSTVLIELNGKERVELLLD